MTSTTSKMAAMVSKAIGSTVEIDAGSVLVVYAQNETARDAAVAHMLGIVRMVDRSAHVVECATDEDLGAYASIAVDWSAVERNAQAKIAELRA